MTVRVHVELPPKSRDFTVNRRFDRTARLIGERNLELLAGAHVAVIGLGGVGSFAVEALARTGVGELTLVDHDEVCVTNTNRQLQALAGAPGQPKVALLYERVLAINPRAKVHAHQEFLDASNSRALLPEGVDLVVDAIDNMAAKIHLIHTCLERGLRLVCSLGAAGKLDPTAVRVEDLAFTRVDPVGRWMRKALRAQHGYDTSKALGVAAVFSTEQPRASLPLSYDNDGPQCVCPHGEDARHACVSRNVVEGSVMMVTAAFGMACAAEAVKALTGLRPVALS